MFYHNSLGNCDLPLSTTLVATCLASIGTVFLFCGQADETIGLPFITVFAQSDCVNATDLLSHIDQILYLFWL